MKQLTPLQAGGFLLSATALNFPAILVQGWILLFDWTWVNLGLFAGAVVLSLSARYCGTGGYLSASNMNAGVFVELEAEVQPIPFESAHPILPDELKQAFAGEFSMLFNPRNITLCSAKGNDGSPLQQVSSFRSLSGSAFVFLPDPILDLTSFQKFCLVREIALCAAPSVTLERQAQQIVWCYSMLWLAILAAWTPAGALPLILAGMASFTIYVDTHLLPETPASSLIRDQIVADTIALDSLAPHELVELDECLAEYPLADAVASDSEVSKSSALALVVGRGCRPTSLEHSNALRTYALRGEIARRRDPKSKQLLYRDVEQTNRREIVLGVWTAIFSILLSAAVASIGQAPSKCKLICVAAFTTLVFINSITSWRYLRKKRRLVEKAIAEGTG
jgi:hypothetical protein